MSKSALKAVARGLPATNQPHTIDWELRLGFLIHDVSRMRRSAFDRYLKPMQLTRSQWWVLAYLSREDGMTQSQLAEELDLGKVAMGGLIDRLEKSGFVRREADASDRRVNRIFLEPRSKTIVNQMRPLNHQFNSAIFTGISDADLERTAVTLDAMKRNIRNLLQGPER
jgi:DNA-binding MarR family transcriptional regulator